MATVAPVPSLIALALQPGPEFVDELRHIWDEGDAAFPLDLRLPLQHQQDLIDAVQPSAIVTPSGERTRRKGRTIETGDAAVVATSGTSGVPKAAVLTHTALAAATAASHDRLAVSPERDSWIACLPLTHMGGFMVVVRAILGGTALHVLPGFDADRLQSVANAKTSLVSLVPSALDRVDASWFRTVLVGASADWRSREPNVVHTYGMTESCGGVVYDGIPLDGTEVRVENQEILLRGPTLLRCYRDGTNPKTADGWFATGDAGELSPDGVLTVHGRLDDVIVTGGEKVHPTEVESVLLTHPNVREVAVTGEDDDEWGERVIAHVVARDLEPGTEDAIRDLARASLPPYAVPKKIVFAESLPRTRSGKVRRTGFDKSNSSA